MTSGHQGVAQVIFRPDHPDVQTELLAAVIEAVEEHLIKTNRKPAPAKKARLIALLYELFVESGKEVDQETIAATLRLVA